ncbi:MAG: hypothetical protein JST52_06525 [Bacteroidetes bacterium]|nr:hypothetical protein [Bacteroidota bacterium]MBS1739962.1 hypothetical protein [Bacteroidota bacterium]
MTPKQRICTFLIAALCTHVAFGQNINGFKITVGLDAPAYIIFNGEIKSFEFNSKDAAKYFSVNRRQANTVSLGYNRAAGADLSPQEAIVMEGKRTHIFRIVVDPKYDINKDHQLVYDYSDLKELRNLINASKQSGKDADELLKQRDDSIRKASVVNNEQREKEAEKRRKEAAIQAQQEKEQKRKDEAALVQAKADQKKLDQERKTAEKAAVAERERIAKEEATKKKQEEAEKAQREKEEQAAQIKKQEEAALAAKKKKELDSIAADNAKKEAAKKAELKKIKDEVERKRQEEIAQKAADDARKQQEEAERKEQARIAAQQKAAAEKERLAQAQREKEQKRKEEQEKKNQELLEQKRIAEEKKKAEHEAAVARLQQLEEERKKREAEKPYTAQGIWERYVSKGINLYDIPPEQMQFNNGDFYFTSDTLQNYQTSMELMSQNKSPLHISSNTIKGVSATLDEVVFKNGFVYFVMTVNNQSKEDFLQGVMNLHWYDQDNNSKKWLFCSYYTFISGFNIVKPGEQTRTVFVSREALINENDKLVLFIKDRRWAGNDQLSIIIPGSDYPGVWKNKTTTTSEEGNTKENKKLKRKRKHEADQ